MTRANLYDANAPGELWAHAQSHGVWSENMLLNISPFNRIPMQKRGPFGCKVACIREGEEAGGKLTSRTWTGFHAGYTTTDGGDCIIVGDYDSGHFKFFVSQNVTVFPHLNFFEVPADPLREFRLRRDPTPPGVTDWGRTTCCGCWRELPVEESTGKTDLQKWQSLPSLRCEDVGVSCSTAQDQRAFENVLYLISGPDAILSGTDDEDDLFAFVAETRKGALSEEMWYNSGKSKREVYTEAIKTELSSFSQANSIDLENPSSRSVWRKRYPDSNICLQFLIIGTKGVEGADKRAKARLVVRTEVSARDMHTVDTRAVRAEEGTFADSPNTSVGRCFEALQLGAGKSLRDLDFKHAYQYEATRGPTAGVQLPPEAWPDGWSDRFTTADPPICQIRESLYGRVRAGDDFNAGANQNFRECGLDPCVDIDPCAYVLNDDRVLDDCNNVSASSCVKG